MLRRFASKRVEVFSDGYCFAHQIVSKTTTTLRDEIKQIVLNFALLEFIPIRICECNKKA
jgi:hypothetical protein